MQLHTHTHIYIYICIYIYIYICAHIKVCLDIHRHIHAQKRHTDAHIHKIYIHTFKYACIYTDMHIYTQKRHTHAHICKLCMHACTHTHTQVHESDEHIPLIVFSNVYLSVFLFGFQPLLHTAKKESAITLCHALKIPVSLNT